MRQNETHDRGTILDRILITMMLLGTLVLMGFESLRVAGSAG